MTLICEATQQKFDECEKSLEGINTEVAKIKEENMMLSQIVKSRDSEIETLQRLLKEKAAMIAKLQIDVQHYSNQLTLADEGLTTHQTRPSPELSSLTPNKFLSQHSTSRNGVAKGLAGMHHQRIVSEYFSFFNQLKAKGLTSRNAAPNMQVQQGAMTSRKGKDEVEQSLNTSGHHRRAQKSHGNDVEEGTVNFASLLRSSSFKPSHGGQIHTERSVVRGEGSKQLPQGARGGGAVVYESQQHIPVVNIANLITAKAKKSMLTANKAASIKRLKKIRQISDLGAKPHASTMLHGNALGGGEFERGTQGGGVSGHGGGGESSRTRGNAHQKIIRDASMKHFASGGRELGEFSTSYFNNHFEMTPEVHHNSVHH